MGILEIRGLYKSFGGVKACQDVSISVEPRIITSLIGPNGAGKSTLFNLITGFLPADSGEVYYNGKRITGTPPHAIANLGVVRTFQSPKVFGRITALENVMVGFPRQTGEGMLATLVRRGQIKAEEKRHREQSLEILHFVGLGGRADDLALSLSFGQQKLLSFARALATNAQVLLLDEPTVGVEPETISKVLEVMRRMVDEQGKTILLVEHNMQVVMSVSDWVILLNNGQVIASGPTSQMRTDARLIEVYLGQKYAP